MASSKVVAMPARYSIVDQQNAALWVVDQEPWRRCWMCDSRLGEKGDDYCGACGARFTPRRYRAELHETTPAGLLLNLANNSTIQLALLRLPDMYDSFDVPNGTVCVARSVEGQTPLPLMAYDTLLLARALLSSAQHLALAGYTLGQLIASDVVYHNNGTVSLRIAPYLTKATLPEHQALLQLIDIIDQHVDEPRITRRFDIADADVNPLLGIIADVRSELITTYAECLARIEAAIVPYATRRSLHLRCATLSDTGQKRQSNEDSTLSVQMQWVRDNSPYAVGVFAVADGMGGHAAGEVASALTVAAIGEHIVGANSAQLSAPIFGNDMEHIVQTIDDAIQYANQRVVSEARQLGNNMGTTLTMAVVLGDMAYIANIGDSRTYLWRDNKLRRITTDHSLVMKLVELKHISEDEIYTHPQRNGVLRSLGVDEEVKADIDVERVRPNDTLLLCSDGLWEMVRDTEMAAILRKKGTPESWAKALVAAANEAGGDDNISVVVIRCEE
jgi:protein phosphatase